MLVVLPPSEAKSAPTAGEPVDLASLSLPALTAHRRRVLAALVRASRRPGALAVLGAGPSLAAEVAANVRLRTAPAAPAAQVYAGVLPSAAGLADLTGDAWDRAERDVLIASALWGAVSPADRIPAYRLSIGTDLPGIGPLAGSWRAPMVRALDRRAAGHLVVDCRSAAYAAAWTPPQHGPGPVTVHVLREVGGQRTVVSHWAKHTRGVLTRHLLTRAGADPDTPAALLVAAEELVGPHLRAAELVAAARGTWQLRLVVG